MCGADIATIQGLALSWPMSSFEITQPFGPSNVILEPPFGPYKHFQTGVDMAAALGTPVMAAADGLIVAVGHTSSGYGNYVVIAHGGGIATLYGHLLQTNASVGDRVVRGQVIGLEGSTGFSTGPTIDLSYGSATIRDGSGTLSDATCAIGVGVP